MLPNDPRLARLNEAQMLWCAAQVGLDYEAQRRDARFDMLMPLYVTNPEGAKILDESFKDSDDKRNAPGSRKAVAEEIVRNIKRRGTAGRDEEMARILEARREAKLSKQPVTTTRDDDDFLEDPDG